MAYRFESVSFNVSGQLEALPLVLRKKIQRMQSELGFERVQFFDERLEGLVNKPSAQVKKVVIIHRGVMGQKVDYGERGGVFAYQDSERHLIPSALLWQPREGAQKKVRTLADLPGKVLGAVQQYFRHLIFARSA